MRTINLHMTTTTTLTPITTMVIHTTGARTVGRQQVWYDEVQASY